MSVPSATTAPVVVTLDASQQVSGIAIAALPEELRTPEGLGAALRRAYLDAVTTRLDERLGPPGRSARKPLAMTGARTAPPPRSDRFGHLPAEELTEFWQAEVPQPVALPRRDVGVSGNDCVRVRLHTTDHFADIDLDPGWLQSARVSAVATAVLEAFEDAYAQRNDQ